MFLPDDLNVELLLDYLDDSGFKVVFRGLHKRNAYNDIRELLTDTDGTPLVDVARASLYNVLPEYMFHAIDRFSHLPQTQEKELFEQQLQQQKQEMAHARSYFAPADTGLLLHRVDMRRRCRPFVEQNSVLHNILADRLTDEQRSNRFIRQAIPFLPACKYIRGDKTLLTLLLRKVFLQEGLSVDVTLQPEVFTDKEPTYDDGLDTMLDDSFVGNVFDEDVTTYNLRYWSHEDCDEKFLSFVDDLEAFRLFLQDFFLSVEHQLHFDVTNDESPLHLDDDMAYNYLDYNANI